MCGDPSARESDGLVSMPSTSPCNLGAKAARYGTWGHLSDGTSTAPGCSSELPPYGFNSEMDQNIGKEWNTGWFFMDKLPIPKNLTKSCPTHLALLATTVHHYSSHKTHPISILVRKNRKDQGNNNNKKKYKGRQC